MTEAKPQSHHGHAKSIHRAGSMPFWINRDEDPLLLGEAVKNDPSNDWLYADSPHIALGFEGTTIGVSSALPHSPQLA